MRTVPSRVVVIVAMILAACLTSLIWLTWYGIESVNRNSNPTREGQAALEAASRQKHVLNGVRHFRAHHQGEYPASLADVVAEGILDDSDVTYHRSDGVLVTIGYVRPVPPYSDDLTIIYDNGPVWPLAQLPGELHITATTIDGHQGQYCGRSVEDAIEAIRSKASRPEH